MYKFIDSKIKVDDTESGYYIISASSEKLCFTKYGFTNELYLYDNNSGSTDVININNNSETCTYSTRLLTTTPDGNYVGISSVFDQSKLANLPDDIASVSTTEEGYTIRTYPDGFLKEAGVHYAALIFYNSKGEIINISNDIDIPDVTVFRDKAIKRERLMCDSAGNIYYLYDELLDDGFRSHIYVWDKSGSFLFMLTPPDDVSRSAIDDTILCTSDGTVVYQYGTSENGSISMSVTYRTIDVDNECFSEIINIPQIPYAMPKKLDGERNHFLFSEGHDIYYYDDTGLYYQDNNSDPVLMFSWITIGLSVDLIRNVIIISPEELYVQITDPDTGNDAFGKISLVPVSSVYGEGVDTPPTLRLAIDQENNPYSARMLKYASSFVRSEKGCQVEIVSYSDTEGGLSANQKLARDISAGDQPDLVVFGGGLSYETLAKQDVFADIYGFIDADPDYDRSDFLGCVLSPFESSDGTLKRLVSEFAIQTMISGKNTVGELESMTLDDFAGFGSSLPDGQYLVSTISFDGKDLPERLLNNTLPVMLDEFVDFESGKCDFDGIRTLLDICTNSKILAVPGFTDPKSLAEKKLLFAPVYYFNLEYFMLDRYMSFPDGDIQYTGYPTTTGNQKNSAVYPVISTSIMKTSASQNTSWELIKYFIGMKEREAEKVTEARDVADLMNFPCTKKGIEGMITVARSYRFGMSAGEIENDDGSISSVISVNAYDLPEEESERVKKNSNLGLEVYFTDEDEKALWSLLDSAGRIYTKGSSVLPIITEEASSCFAGVKSIDDVVGLIQNRVNILINE